MKLEDIINAIESDLEISLIDPATGEAFDEKDLKNRYPYNYDMYCVNKEVIKLLQKLIPQKPIVRKHSIPISPTAVKFVDRYKCSFCGGDIMGNFSCCPYCETKIDWSEIENE